jgi:hypothetical protein
MASIFGIAKKGLGLLGKKKKGKEGLKGLRKKPIGTFSTFPSEIVRTLKGKK